MAVGASYPECGGRNESAVHTDLVCDLRHGGRIELDGKPFQETDVFRSGDWWFLVYSEFTDAFQTRYRIARGPDGPWLAPPRDTVDGRAFYAAKSVEHAGRRFFIGWIPTKQGDSDAGPWQWAGDLAVLEARQEDDGTLEFGFPEEILAAFPDVRQVTLAPVDGAAAVPGQGAADRYAAWLGEPVPERCLVTATVDVDAGTQAFGLLLHSSADGEHATVVRLEPQRDRVVLDRWPRGRTGPAQWQVDGDVPYAVELERACPLPSGRHTVQVLLDGTTGQVVVDDRVALSFRRYDLGAGHLGLFATDGSFELVSLTVAR
jgi:beta-fructofuranosidase